MAGSMGRRWVKLHMSLFIPPPAIKSCPPNVSAQEPHDIPWQFPPNVLHSTTTTTNKKSLPQYSNESKGTTFHILPFPNDSRSPLRDNAPRCVSHFATAVKKELHAVGHFAINCKGDCSFTIITFVVQIGLGFKQQLFFNLLKSNPPRGRLTHLYAFQTTLESCSQEWRLASIISCL